MRPLTISYRGNFQPTLAEHKRHSTENQVAWTLEAMGHTVLRLQENTMDWPTMTHVAKTSDLFMWTRTWPAADAGADKALDELRAASVPSVAFHLDLWHGLSREHQVAESPFFRCDHVYTADGGHEDEFRRAGINHHWSPPGIYAPDAYRGDWTEMYARFPVAFVGSYPYPHPEHAATRASMIVMLQRHYVSRHRVYGGGIRGQELADLYASAVVVVGDSCLAGQIPRYWSDRVPETLGRGGFLVHPAVPGIEEWYTDGEHLRLFEPGDWRQMVTLIDHYLEHPDDARIIGAAGQQLVRERDTYTQRMGTVLAEVLG